MRLYRTIVSILTTEPVNPWDITERVVRAAGRGGALREGEGIEVVYEDDKGRKLTEHFMVPANQERIDLASLLESLGAKPHVMAWSEEQQRHIPQEQMPGVHEITVYNHGELFYIQRLPGKVVRSEVPHEVVTLDFDVEGALVGVEILASPRE